MQRLAYLLVAVLILCTLFLGYKKMALAAVRKDPIPAPQQDEPLAQHAGLEKAVFAGGCFWGTQTVFQQVRGVKQTYAGYSGGAADTATYSQVTTETTGHAESVEIEFDPSKISYGTLLRIFFSSSRMTRRSSTARGRTWAPATARLSSTPQSSSIRSPRLTSLSLMASTSSTATLSRSLCR